MRNEVEALKLFAGQPVIAEEKIVWKLIQKNLLTACDKYLAQIDEKKHESKYHSSDKYLAEIDEKKHESKYHSSTARTHLSLGTIPTPIASTATAPQQSTVSNETPEHSPDRGDNVKHHNLPEEKSLKRPKSFG